MNLERTVSLYDRVGIIGAVSLAIGSTEAHMLPFLPVVLPKYISFLRQSNSIADFEQLHCLARQHSAIYSALRPSGKKTIQLLKQHYQI